jgi:hypothetical protein
MVLCAWADAEGLGSSVITTDAQKEQMPPKQHTTLKQGPTALSPRLLEEVNSDTAVINRLHGDISRWFLATET